MKYGFKHLYESLYMAAAHGWRFVDQNGESLCYCENSMSLRNYLGIVIEPSQQVYIDPVERHKFGPEIGDVWIRINYADCYHIRHNEDLEFFTKSLLLKNPDGWYLSLRKGKPVLQQERIYDERV